MKQATFQQGSIVREVKTGHPYVVVQRLSSFILVVDAESKEVVKDIKVITSSEFDRFCDDLSMKCRASRDEDINLYWEQASL